MDLHYSICDTEMYTITNSFTHLINTSPHDLIVSVSSEKQAGTESNASLARTSQGAV